MRRLAMASVLALAAAACGGGSQAPESTAAPAATAGPAEITFTTMPDPPVTGENTFEVTVMQSAQPVTDAEVSVMFFMPAMPSMNMPEMKNTVNLTHQGGGRYRGTGNVMMAGGWDATVMAMRGGQEIASRKFSVTAK